MGYKLLLTFSCWLFTRCSITIAQEKVYTLIVFADAPQTKLSFSSHWNYPWHVIKHGDGKFENIEDGKITAADTVHLYFTADCKTNVQGGYNVRYCEVTRNEDNINLHFADGQPAYASEFKCEAFKKRILF